ncbi:hypothetical protein MUN82_11745 [Hymenobacter aerilatus]|uniref:Protein BatD n=1 Tax=Hymenobacter aerilatus TaxID=2932251 RepID=A0A8T9SQJ7_9BACT|nr:hypothetical protein [Hymenobacter aerilatus]UOR03621.1 hypothetical protein MUN82_11745 [Hymenobacter aerilatus]
MGKRAAWVGLFWLLAGSTAHGQATPADTLPRGHFAQPTVQVGQPIRYELTYRHAPNLEVIFPDSTANFAPFELIRRSYQPTRTRQGRSLDRTVYLLRTFSLDPVQQLRLPVLVLRGRDTLTVPTLPDSVRLTRTAAPLQPGTPTPTLRANVQTLPVETRFNYPYWLASLALLLLLAGGVVLGFRKSLRRRYQRYRRRKNHAYFLAQYARHVERFELSRSLTNMERAITLWKNYLSGLENSNINSLTTREIVAHYHHDSRVAQALHLADRMIYGNQLMEEETESALVFELLRDFAQTRYQADEQAA